MFAEIAEAEQIRKVPKSGIVRERLLVKPLAERSSKTSLWSRMEDLVISSDLLLVDLSSNKAHLEGYGESVPIDTGPIVAALRQQDEHHE